MNKQKNAAQVAYDQYSPRMFAMFMRYLKGYFSRNFDNLRVLKPAEVSLPADRAAVFFTNHTSWWDPILIFYLSHVFTPGRRCFGPMDADALEKYGFMKKLGIFGVEQDSARGAAQFLRTAKGLLEDHNETVWMTPQGEFFDVRARPIEFRPGLSHLARDCDILLVPVAMEYPFWIETKPEMLVCFGEVIDTRTAPKRTAPEWDAFLTERLTSAMDDLAEAAMTRDEDRFVAVLAGRRRINPLYDSWGYLKAMIKGEKYSASHGDIGK